jgi:hypothetical protein
MAIFQGVSFVLWGWRVICNLPLSRHGLAALRSEYIQGVQWTCGGEAHRAAVLVLAAVCLVCHRRGMDARFRYYFARSHAQSLPMKQVPTQRLRLAPSRRFPHPG